MVLGVGGEPTAALGGTAILGIKIFSSFSLTIEFIRAAEVIACERGGVFTYSKVLTGKVFIVRCLFK